MNNRALVRTFAVHWQNYWILQKVWMESKGPDDILYMRRMIWICAFCQNSGRVLWFHVECPCVCPSISPSVVSTSVHPSVYHFWMITWVNINGFSPNLVWALILWRSGFELLMSKFLSNFDGCSAWDTPIFSFPDDNLSECQWIFTKLGICIDIMEVWIGIANEQISSNFDGSYLPKTCPYFHFQMITWVNVKGF